MIVSAALEISGMILSLERPARHHDILHLAYDLDFNVPGLSPCQGFLDDKGRFMNREQAYDHVIEIGQWLREPLNDSLKKLFSENVW